MSLINKKLFFLLSLFFSFFFFFQFIQSDDNLEIFFLNIGQGDSVLIKTPEKKNILIDGGPDNTVVYKLGKFLPFYRKKIDLMILTHPHSDHVVGLVEILQRYQVKKIFYTGAMHTSSDYLAWLKLIKKKNIPLKIISQKQSFDLENNLRLEFFYPLSDFTNQKTENLNNTSIVFKLIFKQNSFLFTGDIEKEVEEELVRNMFNLKADLLKIGHHGSNTSTTFSFLTLVNPIMAVIQSGEKNKFGHPSPRVLARLERLGIKIYRNDKDGDIRIISDGRIIKVITEF